MDNIKNKNKKNRDSNQRETVLETQELGMTWSTTGTERGSLKGQLYIRCEVADGWG